MVCGSCHSIVIAVSHETSRSHVSIHSLIWTDSVSSYRSSRRKHTQHIVLSTASHRAASNKKGGPSLARLFFISWHCGSRLQPVRRGRPRRKRPLAQASPARTACPPQEGLRLPLPSLRIRCIPVSASSARSLLAHSYNGPFSSSSFLSMVSAATLADRHR